MRDGAPDATAGSAIAKLQPPLDPIESDLDAIDLGVLVHIRDVQSTYMPLNRAKAQDHLLHVIAQTIHLAIDTTQMFENKVCSLVGHGGPLRCETSKMYRRAPAKNKKRTRRIDLAHIPRQPALVRRA